MFSAGIERGHCLEPVNLGLLLLLSKVFTP